MGAVADEAQHGLELKFTSAGVADTVVDPDARFEQGAENTQQ